MSRASSSSASKCSMAPSISSKGSCPMLAADLARELAGFVGASGAEIDGEGLPLAVADAIGLEVAHGCLLVVVMGACGRAPGARAAGRASLFASPLPPPFPAALFLSAARRSAGAPGAFVVRLVGIESASGTTACR